MDNVQCLPPAKIGVVLTSLLLILNIFTLCSSVSADNFEQVNAGWVSDICLNSESLILFCSFKTFFYFLERFF